MTESVIGNGSAIRNDKILFLMIHERMCLAPDGIGEGDSGRMWLFGGACDEFIGMAMCMSRCLVGCKGVSEVMLGAAVEYALFTVVS
jgi:hypothetical protein